MEYQFQPLFKYIGLILILFLFLHQYKNINQDSYLILCVTIIIFVMIVDYFSIDKHPNLFESDENDIIN